MTKNEKIALVSKLTESFKESDGLVVADFRGLEVPKLEELRKAAKDQDVKVMVIKNTLAKIALDQADKSGLELKDTNIFLWGDQLNVAKVSVKYAEKNKQFILKTAHIDGEVCGVDKVEALSKLPGREELIAMLLQVWNAPVQNFTIGLNALKEKKEQESA
ncbi:MAG: 50S ribosomal protein L10 [Campylobacteraceae bacterium]|mgnify:CR=1 FL=1|nr:50S ribosomal protein L10 [Campylobacteraceae bacterium]